MTPKQKRFCEEYLIDLNATQAAIRAGYSRNSAMQIGEQNLRKLEISSYIAEKQKELSAKTGITAERVINELAEIGFSNIQDFIKKGNVAKDFSKMDRKQVVPISSIKITESVSEYYTTTQTEFKLYNKLDALEKLGRHLGIFEKDNQQKTVEVRLWEYARASDIKKHGTRAAKNHSDK